MNNDTEEQTTKTSLAQENKQDDPESAQPSLSNEALAHMAAGTTPEYELLSLYIGPNAEKFLGKTGQGGAWSFNLAAALLGWTWFFYRKLYILGFAILFIPVIISILFPQLDTVQIGSAGLLGATANSLYLWRAKKKVKALKKLSLPEDQLVKKIRRAGGTSIPGAIFGATITVALIVLPSIAQQSATLPGCNDPFVQKRAGELLSKHLTKNGWDADGLKVYDFKRVENQTNPSKNICTFTAEKDSQSTRFYLAVGWQDKKTGQLYFRIGKDQKSVSQPIHDEDVQ